VGCLQQVANLFFGCVVFCSEILTFFALGASVWRSFNHLHTFFWIFCPEKNKVSLKNFFLMSIFRISTMIQNLGMLKRLLIFVMRLQMLGGEYLYGLTNLILPWLKILTIVHRHGHADK